MLSLGATNVPERGKEYLKGSKPLLTVNDQLHRHGISIGAPLVKYHGPQEMGRRTRTSKALNELPFDVLPKRLPVILLFPYVLPLKQGNLVSALAVEEVEDGP